MKYKIAELIVEMNPKYNNTLELAKPFLYYGSRDADFELKVSDKYLDQLMSKAEEGVTVEQMENFAFSGIFYPRGDKVRHNARPFIGADL